MCSLDINVCLDINKYHQLLKRNVTAFKMFPAILELSVLVAAYNSLLAEDCTMDG